MSLGRQAQIFHLKVGLFLRLNNCGAGQNLLVPKVEMQARARAELNVMVDSYPKLYLYALKFPDFKMLLLEKLRQLLSYPQLRHQKKKAACHCTPPNKTHSIV
jgi:hypothetical protein